MTAKKPDSPKPAPAKSAKAKSPIPDGFRSITPQLTIKGAAKAIEFYEKAFLAEQVARMDGPDGAVMHAEIRIGDSMLMLGDENPKWNKAPSTLGGTAVSICIYAPDCDKV